MNTAFTFCKNIVLKLFLLPDIRNVQISMFHGTDEKCNMKSKYYPTNQKKSESRDVGGIYTLVQCFWDSNGLTN
jgi:hypothetical protein